MNPEWLAAPIIGGVAGSAFVLGAIAVYFYLSHFHYVPRREFGDWRQDVEQNWNRFGDQIDDLREKARAIQIRTNQVERDEGKLEEQLEALSKKADRLESKANDVKQLHEKLEEAAQGFVVRAVDLLLELQPALMKLAETHASKAEDDYGPRSGREIRKLRTEMTRLRKMRSELSQAPAGDAKLVQHVQELQEHLHDLAQAATGSGSEAVSSMPDPTADQGPK